MIKNDGGNYVNWWSLVCRQTKCVMTFEQKFTYYNQGSYGANLQIVEITRNNIAKANLLILMDTS